MHRSPRADHARTCSCSANTHAQRRRAVDAGRRWTGVRATPASARLRSLRRRRAARWPTPLRGRRRRGRCPSIAPGDRRRGRARCRRTSAAASELARDLRSRRRRPDLLHANSLSMGRLSGPVAAELGMPSIAHLRDIVRLSRQAVGRPELPHAAAGRLARPRATFHVAGGLGRREDPRALQRRRPRAVPPAPSRPATCTASSGLPAGAPLVGTIGQIGLRKGQDVLVRAAATSGRRAAATSTT